MWRNIGGTVRMARNVPHNFHQVISCSSLLTLAMMLSGSTSHLLSVPLHTIATHHFKPRLLWAGCYVPYCTGFVGDSLPLLCSIKGGCPRRSRYSLLCSLPLLCSLTVCRSREWRLMVTSVKGTKLALAWLRMKGNVVVAR